MIFRVLKEFQAKTPTETLTLKKGQKVKLSEDEAIPLIQKGKIIPIEKVTYRVYSKILGCHLWVVDTDQDMHSLRSQGVIDPIYKANEIRKLKGLSKDSLKEIHKVKETFPESTIKETKNE